MGKSVAELFDEAKYLEEKERATLAGLLLESLEVDPDPDVQKAWDEEIRKRIDQIDNGEVQLVAWEDIKRRLYKNTTSSAN